MKIRTKEKETYLVLAGWTLKKNIWNGYAWAPPGKTYTKWYDKKSQATTRAYRMSQR